MMTGKIDDVLILKNMMLAYLGHLNIQWNWPRCPSPWHALHLSCWVFNVWTRQVWDNQCLTAVLWRIPCAFHFFSFFSISGYMPATKIKSLHSTAGSENIWQLQMWDQIQNHFKETKPVNTLRSRDSFCFLLVSSHFFYPNFNRPIPSQKWILKQQVRVPLNIPKHSTKITCQCTNPFHHLVRATPKTTRKPETLPGPRPSLLVASTVAPAEISCSTTAAWRVSAARCSAVQPRASRMRRGRRAAAAAVEKQGDSHGMFLGVIGQKNVDRSYRYRRW